MCKVAKKIISDVTTDRKWQRRDPTETNSISEKKKFEKEEIFA